MAQQLGPAQHIGGMDNGAVSDDKHHMSFEIITKDGAAHAFWCHVDDAWKFAHYVLSLTQFAAQQSGGLKPPRHDEQLNVAPISAVSLGLSKGRSDCEALLAVHLGTDNPPAFAVSPNELAAFRDLLNKHLVATQGRKPN